MKFTLECTYCGNIMIEEARSQNYLSTKFCDSGNCKDKNLIVRNYDDRIDYYKGCPPFPEKEKEGSGTIETDEYGYGGTPPWFY
jgi:hypothetical protein